jgi:hypothetical protein
MEKRVIRVIFIKNAGYYGGDVGQMACKGDDLSTRPGITKFHAVIVTSGRDALAVRASCVRGPASDLICVLDARFLVFI